MVTGRIEPRIRRGTEWSLKNNGSQQIFGESRNLAVVLKFECRGLANQAKMN